MDTKSEGSTGVGLRGNTTATLRKQSGSKRSSTVSNSCQKVLSIYRLCGTEGDGWSTKAEAFSSTGRAANYAVKKYSFGCQS